MGTSCMCCGTSCDTFLTLQQAVVQAQAVLKSNSHRKARPLCEDPPKAGLKGFRGTRLQALPKGFSGPQSLPLLEAHRKVPEASAGQVRLDDASPSGHHLARHVRGAFPIHAPVVGLVWTAGLVSVPCGCLQMCHASGW